jgi:hypothetical protein
MNNTLKQHAQTLHLSGLLDSLQLRLQEADANRLPYAQFLELLFQDEINVRHRRLINRRHKLADFRELRSLENFDFSFNPTIKINESKHFSPKSSGIFRHSRNSAARAIYQSPLISAGGQRWSDGVLDCVTLFE